MSINQRIRQVMEDQNLNINSFSKRIGMTNNVTIGNIVGNRVNKPSYEVIKMILSAFSTIDARWLITGEGQMTHVTGKDPPGECQLCQTYKEIIEDLRMINRQLAKRNSEIEKQLEDCSQTVQKRKAG